MRNIASIITIAVRNQVEKLNPEKLYVKFEPGVTTTEPIQGRKYTLTHSDITADLFLNIGLEYAYDEINETRDEVLAQWQIYEGDPLLYVHVYIGQYDPITTFIRDTIFRRELPLALEAIRYGDSEFFTEHPELGKAPIWISFNSANPDYDNFEYWGTPDDYN